MKAGPEAGPASMLLRLFGLLAAIAAVGIVIADKETSVYARMAQRIWQGQPYRPELVAELLEQSQDSGLPWPCATGITASRAAIAVRVAEDAMAGRNEVPQKHAMETASAALDAGLACQPLAGHLWLARFWISAMAGGFSEEKLAAFDRSVETGPHEGWLMRLRAIVGARYYRQLSERERRWFFDDFRAMAMMGYAEDTVLVVQRLRDEAQRLKAEIEVLPKGARPRIANWLLAEGIDLKIVTGVQPRPWQHN
ncbi:MAG: hypothetical protein ABSG76_27635 [Xanthobacteraceae bacterium]